MADEPRTITPILMIRESAPSFDDDTADRFIEDTAVVPARSWAEFMADRKPRPVPETARVQYESDVPNL